MVNLNKLAMRGVLFFSLVWPAWTQAGGRPLSLADLEEMALKTHPSLEVAGAEIKKSEAELRIARQYPNPELEGEVSGQKGMENGDKATGYTFGLSQTIEWPGRRRQKQEGARFGVAAARHKLTQEQVNVRARCRELYYRVLAGEQVLKIAAGNLESAKKLLDIAEKRVRLGESRPMELVKAKVEFLNLEREHDKARTTLMGDRQALQLFLGQGLPPDFSLAGEKETPEALIPMGRWQEAALAAHPLLSAQEAQVRQAESVLGAERLAAWKPDVTLKAFHTRDVDLQATGGGLSFPIPLWNRKKGEVDRAAASKNQAKSELLLLKQDMAAKIAAQHSLYETARRQVQSFQNAILREAAESLRVAQFAYEHGETSLLELLDSRRVYRTTEQDYYSALLDYRLAQVELWRLAGGGVQ